MQRVEVCPRFVYITGRVPRAPNRCHGVPLFPPPSTFPLFPPPPPSAISVLFVPRHSDFPEGGKNACKVRRCTSDACLTLCLEGGAG